MIKEAIAKVVTRTDLTEAEAEAVMREIMQGEATDAQIAAYITALRMKGETVAEITGSARVMRDKAVPIKLDAKFQVDTCGTGGDMAHTFNISTTAAFVVAGCGVTVAKHGNRSVSSKSGSADVLQALGVNIEVPSHRVEEALREVGIGFLFAPMMHQAMKYAIGPRREVGIRTIFNLLGPLTNPARVSAQIMGVYDAGLTGPLAQTLGNLGAARAFVVHGMDGLDEITIAGPTKVSEFRDGSVRDYTIRPEDFVSEVTNQYLPLKPGTLFTYKSEDEDNTVEVLSETKTILGVTCTVVLDKVFEGGDLIEETYDWYAQDKDGNVWYMGEDSKTYSNGVITSTAGSWEAGVDGAKPGIIMKADPKPGDSYRQEYYEGEAEDMGDVVSLGESVTVPAGTYTDCLKTRDWTPLEPGVSEFKYYAPGIGFVLETAPDGSGRLDLISVVER